MKVKIELNSKELSTLVGDTKEDLEWDWEIDVYTESGSVSKRGELAVFAGVYWALMSMLPHTIISQFTSKWNSIIEDFQLKVNAAKKEASITNNTPDKIEP